MVYVYFLIGQLQTDACDWTCAQIYCLTVAGEQLTLRLRRDVFHAMLYQVGSEIILTHACILAVLSEFSVLMAVKLSTQLCVVHPGNGMVR